MQVSGSRNIQNTTDPIKSHNFGHVHCILFGARKQNYHKNLKKGWHTLIRLRNWAHFWYQVLGCVYSTQHYQVLNYIYHT